MGTNFRAFCAPHNRRELSCGAMPHRFQGCVRDLTTAELSPEMAIVLVGIFGERSQSVVARNKPSSVFWLGASPVLREVGKPRN